MLTIICSGVLYFKSNLDNVRDYFIKIGAVVIMSSIDLNFTRLVYNIVGYRLVRLVQSREVWIIPA